MSVAVVVRGVNLETRHALQNGEEPAEQVDVRAGDLRCLRWMPDEVLRELVDHGVDRLVWNTLVLVATPSQDERSIVPTPQDLDELVDERRLADARRSLDRTSTGRAALSP